MRVVATAGHVDHGKSSLVLALTGTDPDRWAEEKRRGLTIDLGFAHTTLPNGEAISIVDVPGHVRFLRNMLAGVGAVDACVFVVAATEGWKPQSEEHLRILELLGLRTGVVALTKSDLANDDQILERMAEIETLLSTTSLKGAEIMPVSSVTGQGVAELKARLLSLGESGKGMTGFARLAVDRCFLLPGAGVVVTGTVHAGEIKVGDHFPDVTFTVMTSDGPKPKTSAEVFKGKKVVLGLVSTKSTVLEEKDALIARINEAAKFMPLENLAISPQCGFASIEEGNPISPQEQEAKLRLVVETALERASSAEVGLWPDGTVLRTCYHTGGGEVFIDLAGLPPGVRATSALCFKAFSSWAT